MSLPFWDRNVDLEIASWIPYSVDYSPLMGNRLHSESLFKVGALCLELDSELLFIRSFRAGNGGSLFRDHLWDPERGSLGLGFTIVFAYSRRLADLFEEVDLSPYRVMAGVTFCGVFDGPVLLGQCKALALISGDPFFDDDAFLGELMRIMESRTGGVSRVAYFAERFGLRRFSIPYESEDLIKLAITQALFDITMEETRQVLGPSPEIQVPRILDVPLGGTETG
ncbi:hypothetical protein Taci_1571 [Thermanaerovibrio acidaminovorans DSM 6589]|uniref:Uncharacterized protein n=1 Tax=Thermanaerovibrio acidaminovorans (strain ATCC 49978 / DSM 6589 / Su883) TaxID=525903 RepID=D1B701_THEAS|nr:hypothetical protein [Thermanaerovibrio acidaminovorans]ACZ19792.1 hypothetical protein Taci_1571 [Thermanaerovibrio acidaminovorans DSM 6589]